MFESRSDGWDERSEGAATGWAALPRWPWADPVVSALVALAAALAVILLEEGSLARAILALAALFFVPGHLLLQAIGARSASAGDRLWHALFAVGLSAPLVALAALATTLFGDGFRPMPIVAAVTGTSVVLAVLAGVRRADEHRAAQAAAADRSTEWR